MRRSNLFENNKALIWVYSVLMFLPVVLVFFFYNYYGLDIVMYFGWTVFGAGFFLVCLAGNEFQKKGGVPEGKHLVNTTILVNSGIYSTIRHPQYLGFILIVLGLSLVSQHWLSIASGVLGSLLFYSDLDMEDQSNVEKFGTEYEVYLEKVPRINILLGIIRRIKERRRE
jgi:protein-S-isoprenylcysteine O-methyltransferase Ste14